MAMRNLGQPVDGIKHKNSQMKTQQKKKSSYALPFYKNTENNV